jgi:hypothetical protein
MAVEVVAGDYAEAPGSEPPGRGRPEAADPRRRRQRKNSQVALTKQHLSSIFGHPEAPGSIPGCRTLFFAGGRGRKRVRGARSWREDSRAGFDDGWGSRSFPYFFSFLLQFTLLILRALPPNSTPPLKASVPRG